MKARAFEILAAVDKACLIAAILIALLAVVLLGPMACELARPLPGDEPAPQLAQEETAGGSWDTDLFGCVSVKVTGPEKR
jgi:hypothetical protein